MCPDLFRRPYTHVLPELQRQCCGCYGSGPGRQELGEVSAVFSSTIEFRVANQELLDANVDPTPGSRDWSKAKNRRPRKVR